MMWGYHGDWGWWMVFGSLMMVLFWGGLFLAIYWIAGAMGANRKIASRPGSHGESAEEIARWRLAAGEVSQTEYDQILAKLAGETGATA